MVFNGEEHTHMPYIFEDKLYHCRASLVDRILELDAHSTPRPGFSTPYRAYDIYRSDLDGSNIEKIGGGFGEKSINCSPTAFRENGILKVNYVSTPTSYLSTLIYRQYQKSFVNGAWTMKKFVPNPFGFRVYCNTEDERRQYFCYAAYRDSHLFIIDKTYKVKTNIWFKSGVGILRRAIPAGDKVLITYSTWDDTEINTSLIDLNNMTSKKVKVNGSHIYKCTMHEDYVIHAVKNPGAYNMQLHKGYFTLSTDNISWEETSDIFVANR